MKFPRLVNDQEGEAERVPSFFPASSRSHIILGG